MAEYIEKESTINKICNEKCRSEYGKCQKGKHDNKFIFCVCDFIRWQKPADVAPVVHGRWIYDCNATDWGIGGYICSRCKTKNNNLPCNRFKTVSVFSGAKFCPNCGAKMDLEDYHDNH